MQTFAKFLTEQVSAQHALTKLDTFAVDRNGMIDLDHDDLFLVENPPYLSRMRDVYAALDGATLTPVPVSQRVSATQPYVNKKSVADLIRKGPSQWPKIATMDEAVIVVRYNGRDYTHDGHHRMTAALLLELPNILALHAKLS